MESPYTRGQKKPLDRSSTLHRLQLQQGCSCTPKTGPLFQLAQETAWSWPKFLCVREDGETDPRTSLFSRLQLQEGRFHLVWTPLDFSQLHLFMWVPVRDKKSSLNPEHFYVTITQRTKLFPHGPGQQSVPRTLYPLPLPPDILLAGWFHLRNYRKWKGLRNAM